MDTESFYIEVGRRIRTARKKKTTQESLANSVGLTRTSITNIEKGRQRLSLHTLAEIAGVLQVDVGTLLPQVTSEKRLINDKLEGRPDAEKRWIKAALEMSSEGDK